MPSRLCIRHLIWLRDIEGREFTVHYAKVLFYQERTFSPINLGNSLKQSQSMMSSNEIYQGRPSSISGIRGFVSVDHHMVSAFQNALTFGILSKSDVVLLTIF